MLNNRKRRNEIPRRWSRRDEIPLTWRNFAWFVAMIFCLLVLLAYALSVFPTKPNAPVAPMPTVSPAPVPIAEPNTKQTSTPSNLSSREVTTFGKTAKMKVTAYCPCSKCCGPKAIGKTSTGHDAWKTFGVAADPKLLPYRTKLDIPGVGIREVDDTGGAMRQDAKKGICHIDLRMHSHQEARKFGVKWLEVKILPK